MHLITQKTRIMMIKELSRKELKELNGGIAPLLAYGAKIAAVYGAALLASYYKGYGDAHDAIEPCVDELFSD